MRFAILTHLGSWSSRRIQTAAATALSLSASIAVASHFDINDDMHGWIEIQPGGETRCARDTPFSFFVNPGKSDKVVIDFIGGGACWDAVSCAPESATFTADLSVVRNYATHLSGVYDHTQADNPYREWTHVIIPYCTGDIHWGKADVTYTRANGTQFTVNHRGAINAEAVLSWVKDHYAAPKDMLVTGCSAGSYGSIFWTPHVVEAFPGARIRQFGDSGAGILTSDFLSKAAPLWNITYAAPRWVPDLDPLHQDYSQLELSEFYVRLANHYPQVGFAQFNHSEDFIQRLFYARMGARDPNEWGQRLLTSIDAINTRADNFRSFLAPGDMHCATIENSFYDEQSSGVMLKDWLKDYVEFREVPHVQCDSCD